MKLDYMIYGRGLEQDKGYELQAAPPYVRQELLLYLRELLELGDDRLQSEIPAEILAQDPNPWANTYLFVCQPPPCCCALVRITRAEGDTPDTWLREVREKTVWSLEGWCAPYERREEFFAMLPSILLWMQDDSRSLYNRHRLHQIEGACALPASFVCNPYAAQIADTGSDAWKALCGCIRTAPQPFPFLFGPLADYDMRRIGRRYGITHVFSTASPCTVPEGTDPFESIEYASLRQIQTEQHTLSLQLRLGAASRREQQRRWEIRELSKQDTDPEPDFSGKWIPVDRGSGISMSELLAESELIRQFAQRMGWETAPGDAPSNRRYRFLKEE